MREFRNASGTTSWHVTGRKRDKTRIRENFADEVAAEARQIELELEWKRGDVKTDLKATKLTDDQLHLAHLAFHKLGDDWKHIIDAVDHWKRTGSTVPVESPRIDDAVEKYLAWLEASPFPRCDKTPLENPDEPFPQLRSKHARV